MHVEMLDDRSRPSEWSISAHSHRELNHIFFIAEGGGVMRVEEHDIRFSAPSFLVIPSAVVHGFQWQTESSGSVVTLANSYLAELSRRDSDVEVLFRLPTSLLLTIAEASFVQARLVELTREFGWAAIGHRTAVDAALLPIIVLALRTARSRRTEGKHELGHYAGIVARFRERVDARFRFREDISRYAKALGVSNTTLRAACSRIAGIPPAQILDERTLLEARRALLYSEFSVAEVAYSLGFGDAAYFSRFFSRRVGMPPKIFRENKK